MPRDKGAWSSTTYRSTSREVEKHGTATFRGEQRAREGKGLDPLVDPRTHDGGREANNYLAEQPDGTFILKLGISMPVKTDLDTTGSMGGNVDLAMKALPAVHDMLMQNTLSRYGVQVATGVVQDVGDRFPYQHSQFEPDNEIDRQLTLLVPERSGGDSTEDYQIGLYYTAHRIKTQIVSYGLKGYYFIVGDERGRDSISKRDAKEVLGISDLQSAIQAEKLGESVRESWHTFFLQIRDIGYVTSYWSDVLGRDRVVMVPHASQIAVIQGLITGLTEGVLDLQSAKDFLIDVARVNKTDAGRIVRAVNHIPLRAQAELAGFDNIPPKGSVFASRDDIWPIGWEKGEPAMAAAVQSGSEEEIAWQA